MHTKETHFYLTDILHKLILLTPKCLNSLIRGIVKAHKPPTLKDAMNLKRDLQNVLLRTKYPPKPNFPSKFKEGKKPWKKDSSTKENKGG